ncbi:MAG: hypothetical protein HYR56_04330 [Acidobacteria bacterium]|nr:hypothetical protein [Acidobacteriota bacterium]MBI3421739.1 hypothetical protein [Acidobacteriota bacterium]
MATIKSTTLEVSSVPAQPGKSRVTVTSMLAFTLADAGNWKYSINLYGSDTNEPATGPALIYTFIYSNGRPYLLLTAQPGEQTIQEDRIIDTSLLDEDPGVKVVKLHPLIILPNQDEVYALVELSRINVSNTWKSFGV